jgi:cell division protein FtsQ
VSIGRVWRRRLVALAGLALLLFAGYTFWLRDSSLVAVNEVKVEGTSTNQEQIAAAFEQAGLGMTTLHVDIDQLREAASSFPTIASIRADAGFPHSLTIIVTERLPVAQVNEGGERVAVSGDGYLLPGLAVEGAKLPPIESGAADGRVDDEGAAQAAILAAAPAELADSIASATYDPERGGVVAEVEGAPELRFGDGERAEEKWRAVAAVLASEDLGSPAYLDVSVPERPVTGG